MKDLVQKFCISLIIALIIGGIKEFVDSSLHLIPLPKLYLYSESGVLLGPPYFSVLLLTGVIYIIILSMISGSIYNGKLAQICKQFCFFSRIDYFASNGTARFEFIKEAGIPCMKIYLQNKNIDFPNEDGFTTSADCGIIFEKTRNYWPLPKGFLINDKNKFHFEIKGENGGEQIGVALKNTFGNESKYSLKKFLKEGIRKKGWDLVEIDLSEYAFVTRGANEKAYLANFSIFTNSKLSGTNKQVFYIRKMEFLKN